MGCTLLPDLAREINGHAPSRLEFRGLQPFFDFVPFRLSARRGGYAMWVDTPEGKQTMDAKVS